MPKLLSHILKRYEDRTFVILLKARFIAYCYLTVFLVILAAIIYSGAANLKNPLYDYNYSITIFGPLAGGLAICILGLFIFVQGYFTLSAHLLMICGMATVWTIIFLDHTHVVSRLDTIVFIIVLLAMMPIVILKRPLGMVIYAGINIALLFIFMTRFGGPLNLPISSTISYLADNTIAILAVTAISYQIYTINRRALEKAEHDIQERKQAEESLRKSEERYRTILNEMSEGYYEVDLAGNYTFFNEAFHTLFGYAKNEMLGTNYCCYAAEETEAKQLYKVFNKLFKTKVPVQNLEWDIIRKDGERRTLQYFSAVAKNSEDIPIGFRGIVRDITLNKRAEEEREKLQTQLLQAQKMESVGHLAGGVAHDFNNMLGVIMGHAELALQKARNKQDPCSNMEKIQTAARRSADLTKQLLAFARKQIIEPKLLDLNHTVEKMLSMLRRLIGEDIDLSWVPARKLWPVKMDPTQVDQILANLCVNARDAIDGVGKLTIETGMKTFDPAYCADHPGFIPGDFVMLAVSDNGCGMDKNTLDNVFEPFFTTKEVGKGTGLGLATIYGIVKQNNGFINVYSEPGQGSTFKIYLPRQHSSAEETASAAHSERSIPTGNETILLVEDEPEILEMTGTMLEQKGYSVLSAASPNTAIQIARAGTDRIHLLITDVIMPEMNGRDLAEQVRKLFPEIELLFMSGYTANVIAHHGVLDDGVAFLQKPFSIKELAEKVREVLDMALDKA